VHVHTGASGTSRVPEVSSRQKNWPVTPEAAPHGRAVVMTTPLLVGVLPSAYISILVGHSRCPVIHDEWRLSP